MNTIYGIFMGFFLDSILGDPHRMPHPVRLMGKTIVFLEKVLYKTDRTWDRMDCEKNRKKRQERKNRAEKIRGGILVITVLLLTGIVSISVLLLAFLAGKWVYFFVASLLSYYVLAAKSLRTESMAVYKALQKKDIAEARRALSMIVGRDTKTLNEDGIIRACVETVAENTADGVIAPLFYLAVGGPVAGLLYKAVNTMDSMVGYKNERYLYFGRAAACLDDICNFIPARISGFLMVAAAFFLRYDAKGAWRIFKRDRFLHASPNSAQTEAACAGALGIRLAGPASYFGKKVEKAYIGDELRPVCTEDIKRANRLMYKTAFFGLGLFTAARWSIIYLSFFV